MLTWLIYEGYDFGNPTEEELAETPLPFGGVYNETDYEQRTSLIRNGLEYKGHIGDDLSIDGMLGQEFRTTKYRGLTTQNYGYMHDRGNIFMSLLWASPQDICFETWLSAMYRNVRIFLITGFYPPCTKIVT